MRTPIPYCRSDSSWGDVCNFLYDWQTLLTGIVALVIGGLTIWKLSQQINNEKDHESERRDRQDFASRATLGLILHEIGERLIDTLELTIQEQGSRLFENNLPKLNTIIIDRDIVHALKEALVANNNSKAQKTLAKLITEIQNIQSDLRKLNEKDKTTKFFEIINDGYDWQITIGKAYILTQCLDPYIKSDEYDKPLQASWSDVADFLAEKGAKSADLKAKLDKLIKDSDYFWTAQ